MLRQTLFKLCVLMIVPQFAQAADDPRPEQRTAVDLQRRATGTFYVVGEISGFGPLDLLLDTGSSYFVINETILASLKGSGDAVFSRDLEGSMANGTRTTVPVYRISALRLGESCWVHDVEAAVFPKDTRPILGMNVLSRLSPFTFSAEPPTLSLHQCRGFVTAKAQSPLAGLAESAGTPQTGVASAAGP